MTIRELREAIAKYSDDTEVKCVGWCLPNTKRPAPQVPHLVDANDTLYICAESSYCSEDFVVTAADVEGYNDIDDTGTTASPQILEAVVDNSISVRSKSNSSNIPSLSSLL